MLCRGSRSLWVIGVVGEHSGCCGEERLIRVAPKHTCGGQRCTGGRCKGNRHVGREKTKMQKVMR